MHIGEISFCDKICYNIKSNEYKKQILEELSNLCGFQVIQKHHENYRDSFLNILKSKQHLISVRSNGNPYLLYLTKYNNANQCIFIDKKIQQGYFYPRMILSKMRFDDALFDGTIFDGEMVKKEDNSKWSFILNDLYSLKSISTLNVDLIDRINVIYNILSLGYIEEDISCCDLQVKKYFHYYQFDQINDFIKSLPYTSRGIYFKPMYTRYKDILLNFNDELIKKKIKTCTKTFKETYNNTDIQVENKQVENIEPIIENIEKILYGKKTGEVDLYELYDSFDSKTFSSYACIMKMSTSKFMKSEFDKANITQKIPLRCKYNANLKKWVPFAIGN
jgi:hypothetical protein